MRIGLTAAILIAATSTATLVPAPPAQAFFPCTPLSADRCETLTIQRARQHRARALGGYSDPITFLGDLFSGTVKSHDIQRPITDVKSAREWLPGGKYLDGAGILRPEYSHLHRDAGKTN